MSYSVLKIAHPHLEQIISVEEGVVNLLIVENPTEFYNFVTELISQSTGGEGNFVVSSNGEIISIEKECEVVHNLFSFDFNDKKLLNLLYKKLERIGTDGETILKLGELNVNLHSLLSDLFFKTNFSLDFNELTLQDVLKSSSVKFESNYETVLEKLIFYVNAIAELKNNQLFIFVNLKSVLSDLELKSFYYHCLSVKANLLLIESSKIRSLLDCERAIIITDDLCEIVENYLE